MSDFRCIARGLLLVALLVVLLDLAEGARGGGSRYGGSRSGGSRYGGSRYRARYGGSRYGGSSFRSSTRVRVRYGGSRSGGIYVGGYRGYYDDDYYSHSMTICENYSENDGNGTALGRFVCPMYHQDFEKAYCCGPWRKQHCCEFFEDPARGWGLVMGIIGGLALLLLFLFLVIRQCPGGGSGGSVPTFYDSD